MLVTFSFKSRPISKVQREYSLTAGSVLLTWVQGQLEYTVIRLTRHKYQVIINYKIMRQIDEALRHEKRHLLLIQ